MIELRLYKEASERKRDPIGRHYASKPSRGNAQARRARSLEREQSKHLMHFTRCETRTGSNIEERGHLYTPYYDHPFDIQQAKCRSKLYFRCVFCGDAERTYNNQDPRHDQTVHDVPNNDLVRQEAKIRKVAVMFYTENQEVFD